MADPRYRLNLRLDARTQDWLESIPVTSTSFIQAALNLVRENNLEGLVRTRIGGADLCPPIGVLNPIINFAPVAVAGPARDRDPVPAPAPVSNPAPAAAPAPGTMFNPRTFTPQMNSKLRPKISPEKQAYLDSFKAQPLRPPGTTKIWFPRGPMALDLNLSPEAVEAWAQTLDPLEILDVKMPDPKSGDALAPVPCVSSMAIAFSLETLTPFCGEFQAWAQAHCEA